MEEALEKVKQMEAMNERIRLLEEQLKITLYEEQNETKKPDNIETVNDSAIKEDFI